MIIWQGLGAYALVVPFLQCLGLQLIARNLIGVDAATRYGQVINGVALLATAAIVYVIAQRLSARPAREVIDKATGQEITLRERHTLFYVPMRYWAMFFAVVGAILIVVGLVSAPSKGTKIPYLTSSPLTLTSNVRSV